MVALVQCTLYEDDRVTIILSVHRWVICIFRQNYEVGLSVKLKRVQ